MEWLSGWLKQLILLILLAAFIDLLLPNQAMQRYVKTVVGLFLLMVLMNPLLLLFERGLSAEKLMAEAEALQRRGQGTGQGQGIRPLEGIMAEADRLKQGNQTEARKLAEQVLADEIKSGLERETGDRVGSVKVLLKVDDKGNPGVEQVQVHLLHKDASVSASASDESSGSTAIGRMQPVVVERVKPVTVDLRETAPGSDGMPAAVSEGEAPDAAERRKTAARYIEKQWQVKQDRIRITIQEKVGLPGSTGGR